MRIYEVRAVANTPALIAQHDCIGRPGAGDEGNRSDSKGGVLTKGDKTGCSLELSPHYNNQT